MPKPQIASPVEGIFQCVDCGACAEDPEGIEHYESCKPGTAAYWADYYEMGEEDNE